MDDYDKTIPVGSFGDQSPREAGAQAQLFCFEGCRKTIDLDRAELTVGRQADNDLVLESERVSRRHVRVLCRRAGYYLEDLGSINGTFVNGRRLAAQQPEVLHHKDVIQVCEFKLLFFDWSGLAKKLGFATIRLDSAAISEAADRILADFIAEGASESERPR